MNDGIVFLGIAILLDVFANICLKKSKGFVHKSWGFGAIALIGAAFYLLTQAVKTMELSIAYALWGALGLLLTTGVDIAFYGVRLKSSAVFGIFFMITGIYLMKCVA